MIKKLLFKWLNKHNKRKKKELPVSTLPSPDKTPCFVPTICGEIKEYTICKENETYWVSKVRSIGSKLGRTINYHITKEAALEDVDFWVHRYRQEFYSYKDHLENGKKCIATEFDKRISRLITSIGDDLMIHINNDFDEGFYSGNLSDYFSFYVKCPSNIRYETGTTLLKSLNQLKPVIYDKALKILANKEYHISKIDGTYHMNDSERMFIAFVFIY